jgi:hypothetical protein
MISRELEGDILRVPPNCLKLLDKFNNKDREKIQTSRVITTLM